MNLDPSQMLSLENLVAPIKGEVYPLPGEAVHYLRTRFPWADDETLFKIRANHRLMWLRSPIEVWDRRIIFPVWSWVDRLVVSFQARKIDEDNTFPKYMNASKEWAPDSESRKAIANTLYTPIGGLHWAQADVIEREQAGPVVLCEGPMDTVPLLMAGYNPVALLGSALTPIQVYSLLFEHAPKNQPLILLLDPDKAGYMLRLQARLQAWGADPIMATEYLPEGQDPGDCTPEQLNEVVRLAMEGAPE